MPSAMIHLKTALEYKSDASPLFLIGNLAPDCRDIRELKDVSHFRSSPDRTGDLRRLRDRTDKSDPFDFGILLHLFLDYKWDYITEHDYRSVFFKDGTFAFLYYREQITRATSYIYNHTQGSDELWRTLCSVSESDYDTHPEFPSSDIREFLLRNAKWNAETKLPASDIFTPECVDEFIKKSALAFADFLQYDIL